MSAMERLKKAKTVANKEAGFAEKALMVFKAKGFTDEEIEESKEGIREAWPDENKRMLWVDWINEEAKIWR